MLDKTEFLPFIAINEFMRPDFRLSMIRETLTAQPNLPESYANELSHQIKKHVTVPGFRNSDKAPALIKVLPTSKAFEKNPDLVAVILTCWAEYQSELREQVYSLLKSRNWMMVAETDGIDFENISAELFKAWPVLPSKLNRAKLPGFFTHWPKGEDFEALYTNYTELFQNSDASIDKVSLMAVWLTMRLPYHIDSPDDKPEE
jgi:hypothetical protein